MKKLFIIICTFFYISVSYSNDVKIAEDLYDELRCLVCQNQSIKDSDAPIAKDLRFIVLEMAKAGKNKNEIKSFLVEKHGEFILFKPTFSLKNYILWLAPLIFLLDRRLENPRLSQCFYFLVHPFHYQLSHNLLN